ncbi:helix-turn-helix domain-containing protein [Microvirga puerhi]|uniref:Helix-turn-helix domain-containing protein n=1 Tax=Microvirga puerhi TaxID=2876078 RepID=A0ABS7VTJ6_9HYPH|nr:helix-turn-helix transcriptional regulator [Microvirga puerhi]MBZ6078884.1 helix-turn-helix domain-containing protein [Microvirga puerhi]
MTKKKPSLRDQEIGRRIRARRMMISMSQTDLGDKLGVTFQQIQKYEKGVNRVGSGRLEELARILGVPITFFYDERPSKEGDVNMLLSLFGTMQAFKLLKAFSSISNADTRHAIVQLVIQIATGDGDKIGEPSASQSN